MASLMPVGSTRRRLQRDVEAPVLSRQSLIQPPTPSSPALVQPEPRLAGADHKSLYSIVSPYSIAEQPTGRGPPSTLAVGSTGGSEAKFSLLVDPATWGTAYTIDFVEADDSLHMPDPRRDKTVDHGGTICTTRGFANVGCLFILALAVFSLFAGYPVITHFLTKSPSKLGGFGISETNMTGQVPSIGNFGLIDKDTPSNAYRKTSYVDGSTYELVFSDEFNTDGRSFYPGDDPYWEADDLWYWQTQNLNWYDPGYLTTKDGYLQVILNNTVTNGMNYTGGMMTSWNKFCFTGGIFEANVSLPGAPGVHGLWPAVWSMGNLGRAGYGASLEGTWPYTYDACDIGTLPNQTLNGAPQAALENGDPLHGDVLSLLPGQRLSRCTCPGESHPGPVHSDGSYVGRSAPEIDVFEATTSYTTRALGQVSQSGQWAPFDGSYQWQNTSENLIIPNSTMTQFNSYQGGAFQEVTSSLSTTNQDCYELGTGCFSVYAFEYMPGFDNAYIAWISDGRLAWQLNVAGMAANSAVEISARPVPQEPMYMIINLGISQSFGEVDFDLLTFPSILRVDYVRVYQPQGQKNIGCDPPDFPTEAYIKQYKEAYTNAQLMTWRDDFKQPFPKNNLTDTC